MGPDILEWLPHTSPRLSPEMKERLARVRNQLQLAYARQAVEATRVTLQGTMSLSEALGKLQEGNGNRITGYQDLADVRVTINASAVPFWEALDRILDQAQLAIDPYAGVGPALHVVPRGEEQVDRFGRAYYEGPFRLEATHVTAARDLLNPSIAGLRVRLAIAWEPRTKPISISLPLDEITARDNLDRAMRADGPRGRLSAAVESDISTVEMELPFELPPRDASSIAMLQGTFDVMIPGKTETFEFGELEKSVGQPERRAGVTVTLEETRKNDEIDEISLRIEFDEASNALESHRGWILKNDAYVLDAAGKRVDYGSHRVISQGTSSVRIAYMFALDQPLTTYRFYYQTPSLIIRQPMMFELRKIDLP